VQPSRQYQDQQNESKGNAIGLSHAGG
jgi:hypothetical protein